MSRAIRVLLVGPWLTDPGGVAIFYNSILPRVNPSDFEVRYLGIGSSEKSRWLIHKFTDQFRYWIAIRSFNPDIVHVNPQLDLLSFFRDGLFILVARLAGKKVLVFFHGWQLEFEQTISRRLLRFFRFTYGRADAFIVLAERFKTVLRSWGITQEVHRHHTVVEDSLLDGFSMDHKLKVEEDSNVVRILFLSRLVTDKGLPEFLKVIQILDRRGINFDATIAGDGPLMPWLKSEVRKMGTVSSRVQVVGYLDSKAKIAAYSSHHIYCFPTRYPEGLPTTLLEAMAFGLAVVTCPAGGIADVFENGRMGFLVRTGAAAEIATFVELLIMDRKRRHEIAWYNHITATQRYLASSSATYLEQAYRKLVPECECTETATH